jgi:hypothetical protein
MPYLSESEIRWSSYIVHSGTPNCTHLAPPFILQAIQAVFPKSRPPLLTCTGALHVEYIQCTDQYFLLEAKL